MEIISTLSDEEIEEVGTGDPACIAGCVVMCAASEGFGTVGSILVSGGIL